MLEAGGKINCPIDLFPRQESKIQELTDRINEVKGIPHKAELAQALREEVELLRRCSAFDEGNTHCVSCQAISALWNKSATLILRTAEVLNRPSTGLSPVPAGPDAGRRH